MGRCRLALGASPSGYHKVGANPGVIGKRESIRPGTRKLLRAVEKHVGSPIVDFTVASASCHPQELGILPEHSSPECVEV